VIRWIWNSVRSFFLDEEFFKRAMRPLLITFGLSGVAFADQIASVIASPRAVAWIKGTAIVFAFIGGAIKLGEKNLNADQIKAMVAKPPGV